MKKLKGFINWLTEDYCARLFAFLSAIASVIITYIIDFNYGIEIKQFVGGNSIIGEIDYFLVIMVMCGIISYGIYIIYFGINCLIHKHNGK